jgi:signal transduction histidine kinase
MVGRLERSVLTGVAVYRWAALAWMVAVLVGSRADLAHARVAVVLMGGAAALTIALTVLLRFEIRLLLSPPIVLVELLYGFALMAMDGWVYGRSHSPSLGAAWPLAGAFTAGLAAGPVGGGIAGAGLGLGRVVATHVGHGSSASSLSLISSCVLYAQAGAVAGFVVGRLRTAEAQISAARAREEVARTLHDGVLQTLAVVQRRSTDPELASLAHDQERELRDYLFGVEARHTDLLTRLRAAAGRFERVEGGRVEVIAVDEPAEEDPRVTEALAGAVGEALTNAAKHGRASHVVVYVEPDDDELFISVKDDGDGFDPATTAEGVGLSRSIRGRLADVGGRVEIDARPGRGTEVRLWAPVRSAR